MPPADREASEQKENLLPSGPLHKLWLFGAGQRSCESLGVSISWRGAPLVSQKKQVFSHARLRLSGFVFQLGRSSLVHTSSPLPFRQEREAHRFSQLANMALRNAYLNHEGTRAPGLAQPWDSPGFMQTIFGAPGTSLFNVSFQFPFAASLPPVNVASPPTLPASDARLARGVPLQAGSSASPPDEDGERQARLRQWAPIIERAGEASGVYTQLREADDVGALLANIFANTATATLAKRASAIGLFVRWYEQTIAHSASWPPSEEAAYAYVESLRVTRSPPTRATGFMEALAFCKGSILLDGADEVLSSPRVSGATSRCYEAKRLTQKAAPL